MGNPIFVLLLLFLPLIRIESLAPFEKECLTFIIDTDLRKRKRAVPPVFLSTASAIGCFSRVSPLS
jgi:hypothetical protein